MQSIIWWVWYEKNYLMIPTFFSHTYQCQSVSNSKVLSPISHYLDEICLIYQFRLNYFFFTLLKSNFILLKLKLMVINILNKNLFSLIFLYIFDLVMYY